MIKINLLGEVKTVDRSARLFAVGWIGALLFVIVASLVIYESKSSDAEELQSENSLLESQLANLKEKTKSVADLEAKKQSLTDKLKVISLLKRSKAGPVRLLDDLNHAVPERAWLLTLAESDNVLKIIGFALDNQTVATFMKDLANSDYFEKVDLIESKVAQREGVNIRQFTLEARVNYAGKVKTPPAPGAASSSVAAVPTGAAVAPSAVTPAAMTGSASSLAVESSSTPSSLTVHGK